jgi:uracil-DNA glycosylase family 4
MPNLSREFLEETLAEMKKTVPKWVYAVLARTARNRAGGRARHRDDRPNTFEKIALSGIQPQSLQEMPEDELRAAWSKLNQWHSAACRRKRPVDKIVAAAISARAELKRRKLSYRESGLTAAIEQVSKADLEGSATGTPTNSRGWTTTQTIDQVANQNAKFSPGDAKYQEPGDDPSAVCGACRFFLRDPQGERGKCVVVEGAVAWFGHSDLFIGAEDEARAAMLSAEKEAKTREEMAKSAIPTSGPVGAPIMFVGSSPGRLSAARREPIVGPAGKTLKDLYLDPLGVARAEVALTKAVPVLLTDGANVREPTIDEIDEWADWLTEEIDRIQPRMIVALGEIASKALGDRADIKLPHPMSVRRFGDSGEVARKLKRVKKQLEQVKGKGAGAAPKRCAPVAIAKADPVKRIVYGVVLDPYGKDGAQEDAHQDWNPPSAIEKTAHEYMKGDRVVGLQHKTKANAVVVESSIEQYPDGEYAKAMRDEPHRVFRRKFGTDHLHSGAWVLGVELGEDEWQAYEDGEINAFSPGGYGIKTPISRSEMPRVTFVELVEQPAT